MSWWLPGPRVPHVACSWNLSPLQNWCIKRRSQSIYLQVLTDKHAPEHYRYWVLPKWGGLGAWWVPAFPTDASAVQSGMSTFWSCWCQQVLGDIPGAGVGMLLG